MNRSCTRLRRTSESARQCSGNIFQQRWDGIGYNAATYDLREEQAMHRSRLAGFIIDCQTTNLEAAADFWSSDLGLSRRIQKNPEDIGYIGLGD
jgi:hypothetical protein